MSDTAYSMFDLIVNIRKKRERERDWITFCFIAVILDYKIQNTVVYFYKEILKIQFGMAGLMIREKV